jgi:hypothetical protein
MYFENFPTLYYTLDNNRTGQLVQDIFRRIVLSAEVKNNNVLYELYDIEDGDTPEILADRFYDDPSLYWIILLTNEIFDPRFGWPMDWYRLNRFIERKYPCNLYLNGNVSVNYYKGETVNTATGSARILAADGNRLSVINIDGSFNNSQTLYGQVSAYSSNLRATGAVFDNTPEQIRYHAYLANSTIIDSLQFEDGNEVGNSLDLESVSNREYEIRQNDAKRSIKILRAEFVSRILDEFKKSVNA